MQQIFDIALRPLDGRKIEAGNAKALFLGKGNNVVNYLLVDLGVTDNTLFAHVFLARFKLGLD